MNEPTFTLRASDPTAPRSLAVMAALRFELIRIGLLPASELPEAQRAQATAIAMSKWRDDYGADAPWPSAATYSERTQINPAFAEICDRVSIEVSALHVDELALIAATLMFWKIIKFPAQMHAGMVQTVFEKIGGVLGFVGLPPGGTA